MEVEFWGSEFKKRKNSTKVPDVSGVVKEVVIKSNFGYENQFQSTKCSIVAPSFFVTGAVGYGYCKAWGNYYWITNVSFDIDGAEYIDCRIDVLASWAEFIKESTFFIERCADANYYNTDIRDNAVSVEDMVEHTSSASTYCNFASGLLYVVRILGRGSTGGIGTFVTNLASMQNIFSQMWADIDDGLGLGDLEEFMQMWIADPIKYVVGVYSTPIGASVYANNVSSETVFFGGHETNLIWDRINHGDVVMFSGSLAKPSTIYTDFRRSDGAFSSYTIYIPTVGTIPLSADLIEKELSMDIGADLLTGDLLFTLKADGDIVASYNSSCYATQSIGVVNEANGVISGAVGTADNAVKGNIPGIVEGIKTAMSPSPSVIGSQGGTGCVSIANEIVITCCQKSSGEFPTNDYGRPCCKNLKVGDLTGFVKCGNASIEIASTERIRDEINTYLNTGFFVE